LTLSALEELQELEQGLEKHAIRGPAPKHIEGIPGAGSHLTERPDVGRPPKLIEPFAPVADEFVHEEGQAGGSGNRTEDGQDGKDEFAHESPLPDREKGREPPASPVLSSTAGRSVHRLGAHCIVSSSAVHRHRTRPY
jgi:hypothetical protein